MNRKKTRHLSRRLAHRSTKKRMTRRNRRNRHNNKKKGGMCPCMATTIMRGGDGVGTLTVESADGVPVPSGGLVAVPGESDSMNIEKYKEYFGEVLDRKIVPESQDF